MDKIVIVSGARTAIGTFGGALKDTPAEQLGGAAIKAAVERAGLKPEEVDEVVIGANGLYAEYAYMARMCAVAGGLPYETTAQTVNRLCGSGLQAINTAYMTIACGQARVVVAGGAENMSRYPYLVRGARWGLKLGKAEFEDSLQQMLSCPFGCYPMGVTAENVVERYAITREEQDRFALASQQKFAAAQAQGKFAPDIIPVEVPAGRGKTRTFAADEHNRPDTTLEILSALKPAFKQGGSVTAGNASGINDAGVALVMMTLADARARGLQPLAEVVDFAVSGVAPEVMGIGPITAVRRLVERSGVTLDKVGVVELNEAFAGQSLGVLKGLPELDPARVNPNGGAIAHGHPVGATGAIIALKAIREMQAKGHEYGIATACIGGGQGIATLLRRV